jgi:succinyl-diaminopimelate desuccinylase
MSPHPIAQDPVPLAQELIRVPSVTPDCERALDTLEAQLSALGFTCRRMKFSAPGTPDVDNLYARLGTQAPLFCFAGHIDTVPPGDTRQWLMPPFAGVVLGDLLFGRGANDMKSAIAAFVSAAARVSANGKFNGSIGLLITGDEEGPSLNGTVKMLSALKEAGERIDHCLVGEPTSSTKLGDMMKIGRRGSLTGRLTVMGAQGHVAYPHLADNPIPRLVAALERIGALRLDEGSDHFQRSNLEITTIDVGNTAANVIPAQGRAVFNIRFNDLQTSDGLERLLRQTCDQVLSGQSGTYQLDIEVGGQCFITKPGPFTELIANAVKKVTGVSPELSTTGGTSDARFIKDYCPVAEFGLLGQTMHKVDERTGIDDIRNLATIYAEILSGYFARGGLT